MSPSTPSPSSSPSLDSVSNLSETGYASPVAYTNADSRAVVNLPSVPASAANSSAITALQSKKVAVADANQSHTICAKCASRVGSDEDIVVAKSADLEAYGGERHERYFFTEDFLMFLVEGTVYRIHTSTFTTASPYWAQEVPRVDRKAKPISLEKVSRAEMDAFLSTMYPANEPESDAMTVANWTAVLRLSTMWQFEDKRQLAIATLEPTVPPLEKLVLAREYGIEAWLHPAFVSLCLRPAALSLEEAEYLSLKDVLYITSAREALYKGRVDSPSQEEAAAYVKDHIIAPSLPSTLLRLSPSSTSVKLAKLHSASRHSLDLTLSECPTIEEKRTFAALFSRDAYEEALRPLKSHSAPAFCNLLADFSDVLNDCGSFSTFLRAVFSCGASDQSFITIGTQLLKTVVLALPIPSSNGRGRSVFELRQDNAKSGIRSYRDGTLKFWSTFDEAIVKHGDFNLAIAHATSASERMRGYSSAIFALTPSTKGDDRIVYEQRSANLRVFFDALAEAGLLDE